MFASKIITIVEMKSALVFLIICVAVELNFSTATPFKLKYEGISLSNFTQLGPIPSGRSAKAATVYYASNFVSSWNAAMQYCNQISTTFVSISTGIIDEDIRQLLISQGLLNRSFWTSGILDDASSSFVWVGNGQTFLYTNWETGEPIAHCGVDVCVHVRAEGYMNNQYKWFTENCNSNYNFICVQ